MLKRVLKKKKNSTEKPSFFFFFKLENVYVLRVFLLAYSWFLPETMNKTS